jgi:pyruvate/2-oxoacid:ferredoxin oxidoreductase alpha subunit
MTEEEVFTQDKYNAIVGSLDDAMATMIGMGKTEKEAREWLADFLTRHYFKVWRPGVQPRRTP